MHGIKIKGDAGYVGKKGSKDLRGRCAGDLGVQESWKKEGAVDVEDREYIEVEGRECKRCRSKWVQEM